MKYYIIAGEASGDLHGSNLMKGIYAEDPQAEIRFWGGDLMAQVGGELVRHYKEGAVMGFVEVMEYGQKKTPLGWSGEELCVFTHSSYVRNLDKHI